MKSWADAFGGELYSIVTKYSGSLLLQKVSKNCDGSLGCALSPHLALQGFPPGWKKAKHTGLQRIFNTMQVHTHKHGVMPCGRPPWTGEGDPFNAFPAFISHGQMLLKLPYFLKVLNSTLPVCPLMMVHALPYWFPSSLPKYNISPSPPAHHTLLCPPAALQLALLFISASLSVFLQSLINSLNYAFKTLFSTESLRQVPWKPWSSRGAELCLPGLPNNRHCCTKCSTSIKGCSSMGFK